VRMVVPYQVSGEEWVEPMVECDIGTKAPFVKRFGYKRG
jgi:hypothetical protein